MRASAAFLILLLPSWLFADVTIVGGLMKPGKFAASEATALIDTLVRLGPVTCSAIRVTRSEEAGQITRVVNIWQIAAEFGDDFPIRDGDIVAVPEHVIGCVSPREFHLFLQRYLDEKKAGRSRPEDWDAAAEPHRSHAARKG